MQVMLYQKTPLGYEPIDLLQWRESMHRQIQTWYDSIPRAAFPSGQEKRVVENFDLTYHRALLYLYHPSPNIPAQDNTAALSLSQAAMHTIQLYRTFFDERRLTIYWQAVENLSFAGLALLYSYSCSVEVRDRIQVNDLQNLVHTSSSVLWGMVEHFPAFRNKRDLFDSVSSTILAELAADPPIIQGPGFSHLQSLVGNITCSNAHQLPRGADNGHSGIDNLLMEGQADTLLQPATTTANVESAGKTADPPTPSYLEFENSSFDWDAIENAHEFLVPTWQ
jgi:hypothetical protein